MELRRRRQQRKTVRLTPLGSFAVSACLCVLLVIGICFSDLGQWLSVEVFGKVFDSSKLALADKVTDTVKEDTEAADIAAKSTDVLRHIELIEMKSYILQMGVYEDYDNALASALELRGKGAAGYVRKDGNYRVFAAAYPTEAELKSVRERLQSSGVDSASYTLLGKPGSVAVAGSADQLQIYADAINHLGILPEKLYALYIRFDQDAPALEEGREALAMLEDSVKAHYEAFKSVSDGENAFDRLILSGFDTLIENMDDTVTGAALTRASFSSAVKWLHIFSLDLCGQIRENAGEN